MPVSHLHAACSAPSKVYLRDIHEKVGRLEDVRTLFLRGKMTQFHDILFSFLYAKAVLAICQIIASCF